MLILLVFSSLALLFSQTTTAQSSSIFKVSHANGDIVTGRIDISGKVAENVTELVLNITSSEEKVIIPDLKLSVWNDNWTYIWDTTTVEDGRYSISLSAFNETTIVDLEVINIEVNNKQDVEPLTTEKTVILAVVVIVFIIIETCVLILERIFSIKKLRALKFSPENVICKIPKSAYLNTVLFILSLIIILAIFVVAITDTSIYIILLTILGMAALNGSWAFTHRCISSKIALLILLGVLWGAVLAIILAGWLTGSTKLPRAVMVGSALAGVGMLICYNILLGRTWLIKTRAKLPARIPLLILVIALSFTIVSFLSILLVILEILTWKTILIETVIFSGFIPICCWIVYRPGLISFELREESRTHTTKNMTLNMFNTISVPTGLIARKLKKNPLGKISYEITADNEVNIGVVSIIGDWDTNITLAYQVMAEFVERMVRESYAKSGMVNIRLYSSDDDRDHKLALCKYFGFVTVSSGKEDRLGYYHLELRGKRKLFGIAPSTSAPQNETKAEPRECESQSRTSSAPNPRRPPGRPPRRF